MRFRKYKQVCRLNFFGGDDELKNNATSFYKTQLKSAFYNGQVNTKLYRFKLDTHMKNIKLKNPKLVLESVFLPDLYKWFYLVPEAGNPGDPGYQPEYPASWDPQDITYNENNIILRMKNLCGDKWDSAQDTNGNTLLFSGYNNDLTYINPSPKILYNFTISENFLTTSYIEFEIIYSMLSGENLDGEPLYTFNKSLEYFHCSIVIYEEEEEELLLKDGGNIVDYDRMGPTAPAKRW